MNTESKVKHSVMQFLHACKKLYHKIPNRWHFIFAPIEFVMWVARVLKLNLWVVTGEEILSKQKLSVFYAGIKLLEENKQLILKLAFDGSYSEEFLGRTWFWNVQKRIPQNGSDCSLMIMEVPRFFRRLFGNRRNFYLPCWFDGEAEVAQAIKQHSVKCDNYRVKKNKMNYEVTDELDQLQNFYYNMHHPYITNTYGNLASIFSYEYIKNDFGKNSLYNDILFVKNEKECIAGVLLGYTKNGPYMHIMGIKDGNIEYVRDGAYGAIYYFSLLYSQDKGFKTVNYGLTRPFLKDGVLEFKKRRGMNIKNISDVGYMICPLKNTEAVKGFFMNNPFIYMSKSKFIGAIFVDDVKELTEEELQDIYKNNYMKGISKLCIYRFGKGDDSIQESILSEFSGKMSIDSAASLFKAN